MGRIVAGALLPHPPIMVPEIGREETVRVRKTINATRQVADYIRKCKPDTVIIISPHGPVFRNAVGIAASPALSGNFARFGAEAVAFEFANDCELARRIALQCRRHGVPYVDIDAEAALRYRLTTELDHGALVPLYFLQAEGFKGEIVHLSVGFLEFSQMEKFGEAVHEAVQLSGRKVAIIASGDLSHRLDPDGEDYNPRARNFDEKVLSALTENSVQILYQLDEKLIEEAGQCGLRSLFFLFGTLKELEVKIELVSYEAPFGVGYAVAVYRPFFKEKGDGL